MSRPNPKILLDIYCGTINGMRPVKLRSVKEGGYFKRKPDAKKEYIRNHYNRKDAFGPANFSCTDADNIGKEIFLKPDTIVYVEGR